VAAVEVLRRLELLAAVYGLALGTVFATLHGARRGIVLTGGAAVSIVALRSLEGVVRRLGAPGEGSESGLGSKPELGGESELGSEFEPGPPPGLGWRYPLRLLLLVVLVSLLVTVGRDALALVLGVSAVPAALLAEAALQLLALRRGPTLESREGPESRQPPGSEP
jgi:hypothetical protein